MLDDDPLDFIERHFIGPPVIKLCRAGRGMVGHVRRFFQLATILQIGGDPGAPEGVIADGGLDARCSRRWRWHRTSRRRPAQSRHPEYGDGLERVRGIEPLPAMRINATLPLSYTRLRRTQAGIVPNLVKSGSGWALLAHFDWS